MKTCNYCGKPLTLTPEYDMCMECQGRIMRESTIPQGAFATNSTQQMITHEEVIQISKHYNLNINQSSTIEKYALQQQAKEERAKKEHELLGLYKELSFIRKFEYKKQQPSDTEIMCMNEINALEEELK